MARQKQARPTWAQMTPKERRETVLGLVILAVLALVFLVIVATCASGSGEDDATAADNELTAWYDSTLDLRTQVATAAADVRTHVAARDGARLQPACAALDTATAAALDVPVPQGAPAEVATGWSIGAGTYGQAATRCGELWGTPPADPDATLPAVIQSLDDADEMWRQLARAVGGTVATPAPAVGSEPAGVPPSASPAPAETRPPGPAAPVPQAPATEASPPPVAPPVVSYSNCDEVRAAGAAPLHAGEPGYSRSLDKDGDGVACEVS